MTTGVVIVAAGRGSRFGSDQPKQYRLLAGKTVLERTLSCFLDAPAIDRIQVVIHPDDQAAYQHIVAALACHGAPLMAPVFGGATRQMSVCAGIAALGSVDTVLIHDAARPFVSKDLLQSAVLAAEKAVAAIPAIPVTDTIKQVDERGVVIATPPRESLRAVQTPQVFAYRELQDAHRRAAEASLTHFSDDGALMEWAGYAVAVFPGDPANVKLTYEVDFQTAEKSLLGGTEMPISKTGIGFDVHAMGDGDHVWIGGIKIPHAFGVVAHSDGDVVLHALTDAVLGALADGDIGTHFPPSDPQWRDASSDRFLAFACQRARERGGIIDHFDIVLLCEAPRLSPHRDAMRRRISEIAGIPQDSVSIKATTTERLGFVGRQEGIAAQAVATLRLPEINQ